MSFGYPLRTGLLIAASLAQIGEFSFILAGLGVMLNILPQEGRELILAGAIVSIMLNPLLFYLLDRFGPALRKEPAEAQSAKDRTPDHVTEKTGHTVLVGFGRVGKIVGNALMEIEAPLFVMDDRDETVANLRERGVEAVAANAVTGLGAANLKDAHALIVAIPDCFEAAQIVEQARKTNVNLTIIARAHSDAEEAYLKTYGATEVIQGSRETADAILAAIKRKPSDH
jgi:CPA2 family monovalent cation:H+ antiporter-2